MNWWLILKFGLNWEVLEFLWKTSVIMKTWLFDDMNPCLMCFNGSLYLCYLLMKILQRFWVNGDKNWDFRVILEWVPDREPIFWVPMFYVTRPSRLYMPRRDVLNNKCCSAHLGLLGLFLDIPSVHFEVCLMLFWLI